MGGEEFAVVLRGADSDVSRKIFDKIRVAFLEIVHRGEDRAFQVTLSCGLATYPQYSLAATHTAVADKALYEAKRSGRNRVVVSQAVIRETVREQIC